ncbi:hypothetical protein [Nostoc sp.]
MTLAFKLPELIYPSFCSDVSPYADEIQENMVRWADWMERYSSMVALYLEANRWEARNRKLAS